MSDNPNKPQYDIPTFINLSGNECSPPTPLWQKVAMLIATPFLGLFALVLLLLTLPIRPFMKQKEGGIDEILRDLKYRVKNGDD